MTETIAGIDIPDTELAREATELVRKASTQLLFDHSRRVFLFASLKGRYRGIETDVLGLDLDQITAEEVAAVVAAHPRPDFKNNILRAFYDGMKDRPDTTFGTMNDDVLAHLAPGFTRPDFVDIITSSPWPE
jgi:hypothetical protein